MSTRSYQSRAEPAGMIVSLSGAEFGQQPAVRAASILLQPDPAEEAEPESNLTTHAPACVYNMKALVGPAAAAA